MSPDVLQVATRAAITAETTAERGSGALLGLSRPEVWSRVSPHLPIGSHRSTVRTSAVPEIGALTHLLWWSPSVGAVLVDGPAGVGPDIEAVRRVIELTGSDALLLVDAPASRGLSALEHDARWADLVVVSSEDGTASLVTWSARLAPALELLDGMHPLSYDVLSRFQ